MLFLTFIPFFLLDHQQRIFVVKMLSFGENIHHQFKKCNFRPSMHNFSSACTNSFISLHFPTIGLHCNARTASWTQIITSWAGCSLSKAILAVQPPPLPRTTHKQKFLLFPEKNVCIYTACVSPNSNLPRTSRRYEGADRKLDTDGPLG